MTNLHKELLNAIAENKVEEAKRLIRSGLDLNVPCDQGETALYSAILSGDTSLVRLMLEQGADPNFIAHEPAATIYAENPLELASQARFLIDWIKYHPIVKLLEEFGATDSDGRVETNETQNGCEVRARGWQAGKSVQ